MQSTSLQFEQLKVRHVIIACCVIHILVGFALFAAGFTYDNPAFVPIFFSIGIVITCFWIIKKCSDYQLDLNQVIGGISKQTKWVNLVGITFLTGLFSFGSILTIIGLISIIISRSAQSSFNGQVLSISGSDTVLQKVLLFFTTVIIAPVAEEFLFRGIILNRWIKKWGLTKALIASSILFGCLHINPIGLSMFALVMGILYLKSQTLWVPIFCHSLNNLFIFSLQLLTNVSRSSPKYDYNSSGVIGGTIISAIITIVALAVLLNFIRKSIPKEYVQKSYSIQVLEQSVKSGYAKYLNAALSLVFMVSTLNAIVQIFTYGKYIYRDNFSSDPYRYVSSDMRPIANLTLRLLEFSISKKETEDALRHMEALSDLYKNESTYRKDPNISKILLRKSQEIRRIRQEVLDKKIPFDFKIIEMIKSG